MPFIDRSIFLCCAFESLFIVTEAVFLYAHIDIWFHPIYVSFVYFCYFFPFVFFQVLLALYKLYMSAFRDILRRYLT